jgi:tetratricopeptide (TPR) repeat protein
MMARLTRSVDHGTLLNATDLSIAYYNIGQIYYQRGEMELAVDSFKEAHSASNASALARAILRVHVL